MYFICTPTAEGTDTVAYGPDSDGSYTLHGYKWFTSATDANMAFTLARLVSKESGITQVLIDSLVTHLGSFGAMRWCMSHKLVI